MYRVPGYPKLSKYIIYGLELDGIIYYVGLSTCGLQRPQDHLQAGTIKSGVKRKTKLYRWINKRIEENKQINIVILEQLQDKTKLPEREIFWISHYNTTAENRLNITPGGENYQMSDEYKEFHREKEKYKRIRIKRSDGKEYKSLTEASKDLSNNTTDLVGSIYCSIMGKFTIVNGYSFEALNRPDLQEIKELNENIREQKKKLQYRPIVDQHGTSYNSISEAADTLGICLYNISAQLNGRRNHVGGYIFKYLDSKNKEEIEKQRKDLNKQLIKKTKRKIICSNGLKFSNVGHAACSLKIMVEDIVAVLYGIKDSVNGLTFTYTEN